MPVTVGGPAIAELRTMRNWMWTLGAVGLGAVAGYLYWHFVGCDHGCAISSVWWRSTGYGAIMGYLTLGLVRPLRERKAEGPEP